MTVFLCEAWEDMSEAELARSRGVYLAFTASLEEGSLREQFRSLMDPMLSLQDLIVELKQLQAMWVKFFVKLLVKFIFWSIKDLG